MIKKLRQNRKNKKGFTLVELIVVIVIILVLAAVMVPSVLRYVEKARQASCKADAAATLVELQANVADLFASADKEIKLTDLPETVLGKTLNPMSSGGTWEDGKTKVTSNDGDYYVALVDDAAKNVYRGDLVQFIYSDGNYTIYWTAAGGWTDPYIPKSN